MPSRRETGDAAICASDRSRVAGPACRAATTTEQSARQANARTPAISRTPDGSLLRFATFSKDFTSWSPLVDPSQRSTQNTRNTQKIKFLREFCPSTALRASRAKSRDAVSALNVVSQNCCAPSAGRMLHTIIALVGVERPRPVDRRDFLRVTTGSLWALGSSFSRAAGQDAPAGSRLVGTVPFISSQAGRPQLDAITGAGLDGRLFTDLESLRPDALITPTERFFVRTTASSPLQSSIALDIAGLVGRPQILRVGQLQPMSGPAGTHLLECSGNIDTAAFGLMSAATWEGVPLVALFERA